MTSHKVATHDAVSEGFVRPVGQLCCGTLSFLVVLGIVSRADAQNEPPRCHYFIFVAPVTPDSADAGDIISPPLRSDARLVHIGGGGEAKIANFVGIGTEFGGIPNATTSAGMTVISVNGYFHVRGYRDVRIDPFVTVGYTGFFAENQKTGGANLRAGVNWWFHGGLGLTAQLRRAYGANYREILVGLALRP